MNQRKYLVYAVLILLLIAGGYFAVQKFSQTKAIEKSPTIIDYNDGVDSLPKSQLYGKTLYTSKCMSCHGSFSKTDGPWLSLAGVNSMWPDEKELFAFIRNPEQIMKTNSYARELKKRYGSKMTAFPDLTDQEIRAVIDYIKLELNSSKGYY